MHPAGQGFQQVNGGDLRRQIVVFHAAAASGRVVGQGQVAHLGQGAALVAGNSQQGAAPLPQIVGEFEHLGRFAGN